MSATLGGLNILEKWLSKSTIYSSDHRPVPLTEYTLDARTAMLSIEPGKEQQIQTHLNDIAIKA